MQAKYFYGYNIVACCFIVQGVFIGGMFAYGVFFPEIEAEFGWSRATISGASSLAFLVMGAVAVLAGRLNDRVGPRALIVGSGIAFALGYSLLSVMDAPWQLFLFYGVLAGVGFSTHDVVPLSTVARWFVRRRGIMTGITKAGTGVGQVLVPLTATLLIASYGWREACVILGVASGVILLLAAQALRRDPRSMGLRPDGGRLEPGAVVEHAESGVGLRAALATPQLWILCFAELLVFFCLMTVMIHIVPHGIDRGLPNPTAAALLSVIGGVSVLGRLTIGALVDRLGGRRSLMICFAVLFASLLVLQWAPAPSWLFAFAAVYGFAHGAFFTVFSPTVAELFGTGSHGLLFGLVLFCGTLGGAVGPLLAGMAFDATASYGLAFLILTAASVAGLALVSALRPMPAEPQPLADAGTAAD